MKFQKVLIANRGEIACRLIQACKELGLKTVALASDPDRSSPHTLAADECIFLRGASPQETYLNFSHFLPIAKSLGCDAVHPGYGFLSERAEAAEAFEAAGIKWIGPSARSIRQLGDKLEAKKLLVQYHVPTTPWGEISIPVSPEMIQAAEKVGFPILLKAASGGGGKGMRVVHTKEELLGTIETVSREALSGFGDSRIFFEKFVVNPRHIEVQILGDHHGTVITLGERECSLQRRHQKIVEEAPATNLSQPTKEKIYASALALAKGVGYENAGTVEYMVDDQENFYFLEVNSRLQVEHSVTEAVWGVDLVRSQIQIAQGKKLSEIFSSLSSLVPRGHALQTRIYAEDPSQQFAPCPGKIELLTWPQGVGLRIDTGVESGSEIGLNYDAMIAKMTAQAENREMALERLLWGLKNTVVFGTVTNLNFLQDLLSHEKVRANRGISVKFVESEFKDWKNQPPQELLTQVDQLWKNTANGFIGTTPFATATANRNLSPWESKI